MKTTTMKQMARDAAVLAVLRETMDDGLDTSTLLSAVEATDLFASERDVETTLMRLDDKGLVTRTGFRFRAR